MPQFGHWIAKVDVAPTLQRPCARYAGPRLHSLDALRGIAALSVVLWHWRHFKRLSGVVPPGWQPASLPLYTLLKPAYLYGWMAVDLFFVLSGFVFFWLYADAIASRRINAGRFALLRFSRLYPLHWLTLAVVVILQWTYHLKMGKFFVFQTNDLGHFVASIGLMQNWIHATQSFNGPTWSVSVEVLLYIIFFAMCWSRLLNWQSAFAMIPVGFALQHFNTGGLFGRGIVAFFIGGIAFHLTEKIKSRSDAARLSRISVTLAITAWTVVIAQFYLPALSNDIGRVANLIGPEMPILWFVALVCAPTLVALALHEQVLGYDYSKLSFLGDISYSTYLLHFPMQLFLVNIAVRVGWTYTDFASPFVLIVFYAALIGLGALSYRQFERPMQTAIRERFERRFAGMR